MSRMTIVGFFIAITMAAALTHSPAHADTMRCGRWIVDESMTPSQILAKCGEPSSKETKTEEVQGRTAAGYSMKRGTTTTETWTYGGENSIAMRVVIVDGKVKSVGRAE